MKRFLSVAVVAALSVGPAYAACTYPKAPDKIPDGSVATLDEMRGAQQAVKAFDAAVGEYQKCLEDEHNAALAAAPELSDEQKAERAKIRDQKLNAAGEEVQTVADRLNAQIRVFREKAAKAKQ
jgi:hypothetical protein